MVKGTDFKIEKEVYDRAQAHNGYLADEDKKKLFSGDILYGYGLYKCKAYEKDGEYWCSWYRGNSCD